MTTTQKVIKYCALAFAIAIIANIIVAILFGVSQLSGILGLTTNTEIKNMEVISPVKTEPTSLEIDLKTAGLEIKTGPEFTIEANSKNIKVQERGTEVKIKETSHNWIKANNQATVQVTIPEDAIFREMKIETGAGKITVDSLTTDELDLDMGAGKVEIKNLTVTREAEIDGGAGKMDILAGIINNLDLDMGVGKCSLTAILTGTNKIEAGVGELNINLLDTKENYRIQLEKGLGSIKLNQEEVKQNVVYGTGRSSIKVKGGIGTVHVTTTEANN